MLRDGSSRIDGEVGEQSNALGESGRVLQVLVLRALGSSTRRRSSRRCGHIGPDVDWSLTLHSLTLHNHSYDHS